MVLGVASTLRRLESVASTGTDHQLKTTLSLRIASVSSTVVGLATRLDIKRKLQSTKAFVGVL